MKWNWGTGIALVYTLFVVTMVGMVVYSKTLDNSLVVDNYYEEDIAYQQHIDKLQNAASLPADLRIELVDQSVDLVFPPDMKDITGKVSFYRADDKSLDFAVDVQVGKDNTMRISTANILPGKWEIKVDWFGDGRPFYKEQAVYVGL